MSLLGDFLKNEIVTDALRTSDQSMKENAGAAENAGLEVRVTRTYDGVGLSGGRECQWCLDRCGENMTLQEAYNIGAFQRHPGCGCEIEYSSARGITTVQTRSGGKDSWLQKEDIERRKQYGVKTDTVPGFLKKARLKSGSMTSREYAEYKAELTAYKNAEQIILPKDEYAMVMRAFNSPDITDEERKHALITRPIRNKYYTVVNYGYDNYKLIDMWEIEPDFEGAYSD